MDDRFEIANMGDVEYVGHVKLAEKEISSDCTTEFRSRPTWSC